MIHLQARSRLATFFFMNLILGSVTSAVLAEPLIKGTCIVEPSVFPAKQEFLADEMKAAGVQIVRFGLNLLEGPDADKRLGFVERLYKRGIKVDLGVGPQYPPGSPRRKKVPGFDGQYTGVPLSLADLELSRAYFKAVMRKLDEKKIVLGALEVGNEINGASFNQEFPIPGESRIYGMRDLEHGDREARQIAKGFLKYIEIVGALKEARDHSIMNRNTPIISAGLMPTGPVGRNNGVLDAVNPNETIKFFRRHGIDKVVDAYGIHFYGLEPRTKKSNLKKGLAVALSQCGVNGSKPAWITEWGMKEPDPNPKHDTKRARLFKEAMNEFRRYNAEGRLVGVIQFYWGPMGPNEFNPLSIYRNGAVTEAGREAFK